MPGMAKKRKSSGEEAPHSRHKPRAMVPIPKDLYDLFGVLAERRHQSVASELRRLMIEELRKEGLWTKDEQ